MSIVVVIVRERRKHLLPNKPRRLTVRDLLPRLRQRKTDLPHPLDLLLAYAGFRFCLVGIKQPDSTIHSRWQVGFQIVKTRKGLPEPKLTVTQLSRLTAKK